MCHQTQAQVYAPPKSMEADRPSKEKSLPGGFQVACECICRCSRCCQRIYGTTSRQAFPRQLRRCVALQGPTVGIMRPGGGMNMWERSLLPSGKLSRHGRLVEALEHHTMQPNALPDVQCIMLAKKLTRRSTRILTQSLQNYTALQTSLEKRMPTL